MDRQTDPLLLVAGPALALHSADACLNHRRRDGWIAAAPRRGNLS